MQVLVTCCSSVMNKDLTTSLNFSKLFERKPRHYSHLFGVSLFYRPHTVLMECNDTVEELYIDDDATANFPIPKN